jgi:hypothetical protein
MSSETVSEYYDPEKHLYFKNGVRIPSVTQVLVDEGFINTFWFNQESRNRGSEIHSLIVKHHLAGCAEVSGVLWGYMHAYKAFIRDCKWVPYSIEQKMYSELFAGTPDQLGYLNDCEAVIDWKSGGICPATGLQLSGYEDLSGRKLKRFALQLTQEGKYKLTEYKDKGDKYIFKSAVAIWWYKLNNRIRG